MTFFDRLSIRCAYLAPLAIGLMSALGAAPPARAVNVVPAAVLEAEQSRIRAIAKAMPAAVSVFAPDGKGGGSAVVVTPDGYALTNFHVVAPVGDYLKCSLPDGRVYDAVAVSIDPTGDVAMIKLFGREDFPVAELGDSDRVRVGDWCFAIGNPFLLATDLQPSVSFGIVSGVHRYQYPSGTILEYADCIQTDAAINPGNSGGPLFDSDGRLIGINGRCSFEKRGRVNVGVGYAISINQIKKFWGHLQSGRILDHATLGATVVHDADGTIRVSNILSSSDAYRRGLRYADQIVSLGGRNIGSVNEFKNVLGTFPKGWRIPLSYRRDGNRYDIFVRLAGAHTREELLAGLPLQTPEPEVPPRKPSPKQEKERTPQLPVPPNRNAPAKAKVPDEFARFIQPRPGFTNFYFNELNRSRVWKDARAHGDFTALDGPWRFRGTLASGDAADFTLGSDESSAVLPTGAVTVSSAKDISEQLQPEGSGGLLATLHLWRRLLLLGPERYGEVFFLGTAPLPMEEPLFDVLVATHDVAESHFYFTPEDGRLAAVEMFPDTNVDPCEIHFSEYREVMPGRWLPFRLTAKYGDTVVADIHMETVELPAPAPAASKR